MRYCSNERETDIESVKERKKQRGERKWVRVGKRKRDREEREIKRERGERGCRDGDARLL